MAEAILDFSNRQESSSAEVAGAKPFIVNMVTDQHGAVRRRPGVMKSPLLVDSVIDADGIHGLHQTISGRVYVLSTTQKLYEVADAGFSQLTADGSMSRLSIGLGRPMVAETELLLVIAAGGDLWKLELSNNQASTLGGSPPQADHVVSIASRLVANDVAVSPNSPHYSDIASGNTSYAGHEVWTVGVGTAGVFSAEANPDAVTALATNGNELFCFGQRSVQVFAPDPVFRFAPVASREWGVVAPHSVVQFDTALSLLAAPRRFIVTDGRSSETISDAIQSTLDAFTTVDDCWGFRVRTGPLDGIVWVFPTEGRAFCWQKGVGWSEWSGWDDAVTNFKALQFGAAFQSSGAPLVGTLAGKVGELSFSAFTDFGEKIVGRARTGFENRGTDARKRCKGVRIRLRVGQTSGQIPLGWLRWRDSLGPWKGELPISFGPTGHTDITVQKRSLGVYRSRQWEWEASGPEDTTLASITEEYEVLPC